MLKEIRTHGRGGQGAVTAAELLAVAAFEDGKYSQAFPFFGVERRGAPVMAFTRISDEFIRRRQQVYEPDYIIVLDASLLKVVDVTSGLKKGGKVLVNTAEEVKIPGFETYNVDATQIGLDVLGKPIVNTPMLGAFCRVSGEVKLDSLKKVIKHRFPGPIGDKNAEAIQKAYDTTKG